MPISLTRRRWALFALFFLPGLTISSWVTRTPAVRDLLEASTGQMGLIMLGLSAGSMLGVLSSGPLVMRWSTRPIIVLGALLLLCGLPLVALSAIAGTALLTLLGLFLIGLGIGTGEIAMNIEGADVEAVSGKPFLPAMHGCFSFGTVVGALLGIGANALVFPVVWHLLVIAALGAALVAWALRGVVAGTGRVDPAARQASAAERRGPSVWRDTRLLMIGGVVLAMALAEGSATDWLPLVMVDGYGVGATFGSSMFAIFAAAMTVGRFAGGPFVARIGRSRVLLISALAGAAGVGIVVLSSSLVLAMAAVVLWGLGASLGFPLALSAAGDSGPDQAARVSMASTIGYLAFLVGPPALGLLGDAVELRYALLVPLAVMLVAAILAPATRTVTPQGPPRPAPAAPHGAP